MREEILYHIGSGLFVPAEEGFPFVERMNRGHFVRGQHEIEERQIFIQPFDAARLCDCRDTALNEIFQRDLTCCFTVIGGDVF